MEHVLIAGVGFVGVNLAEEITRMGDEVIVIARKSSVEKRPKMVGRLRELGVEIRVYKNINKDNIARAGGDAYYYLAGKLWGSYRDQWIAHVGLLEEAIMGVEEVGARLVLVSSIAALGIVKDLPPGSTILEEEKHLEGDRLYVNTHMKTKSDGERLLVANGDRLKGRWSIVRPGIVYGPWGCHLEWRLIHWAANMRISPRLGRGIPHIYSRDLARILYSAGLGDLDSKWINAVDPLHPDLSDIAGGICRSRGFKCMEVPIWWILNVMGIIAPSETPIKLAYSLLKTRHRYSSRYLKDFNWTPLEEQVKSPLLC